MILFKNAFPQNSHSESGATLLFVIVLITILALLGVGIFSMISTSRLNQAESQKSARAYYLSESCLRIAASEYKHARTTSAADAASALVNLQGSTLTMPDNQGSCSVSIYPYWFYAPATISVPIGQKITLYLPGAVPTINDNGTDLISLSFPAGVTAKLKKKGSSTEVYEFTSASFVSFTSDSGYETDFTLKTALTSALTISAGDEFYLGATYILSATPIIVKAGENLVLNLNALDTDDLTGYMFPPVKGSIFIDMAGVPQLSYDTRDITNHTVTLTNIQAVGSTTLPLTISSNPTIYMGKSLGIKSESTYGN